MSRKAAKSPAVRSRLAALLPPRTIVTNLTVTALAGAVLAGMIFGEAPLRRYVGQKKSGPVEFSVEWPAVAGDARKTWLPESARREITAAATAKLSADPFDQRSLDAARDALLRTGWFTAVTEVRRRPDNRVSAAVEWRTPKAVVRHGGKDHLVGAGGELLPLVYPAGGAGRSMRVIEGVSAAPPVRPAANGAGEEPAYGEPWGGGDVQAALALLRVLESRFHSTAVWSQVAGVDTTRHQTGGVLAIITDTGSRVVWGAAPGVVVPGQQPTEQKIARLDRLARGPTGRIDANERLVEIHGAHVFKDQTAGPDPARAQVPGGE